MNITKKLMIAAGLFVQLSNLHAGDAEWLTAFNAFGGADKVKARSMDAGDARAKAKKAGNTPEMQAVGLYVSKMQNMITKGMFPQGAALLNQVAPALASAQAPAAPAIKSAMAPAAQAAPTMAPASVSPAPVVVSPAPVAVAPAPVVSAPAPVVSAPAPVVSAPVVVSPAPVVVSPAPVVSAPKQAQAKGMNNDLKKQIADDTKLKSATSSVADTFNKLTQNEKNDALQGALNAKKDNILLFNKKADTSKTELTDDEITQVLSKATTDKAAKIGAWGTATSVNLGNIASDISTWGASAWNSLFGAQAHAADSNVQQRIAAIEAQIAEMEKSLTKSKARQDSKYKDLKDELKTLQQPQA